MAFILAFLMARRMEKREAFELFKKGWTPPDVADYLLVPLRTVQRWCQEYCKIQKPVKTIKLEKDRESGAKNDTFIPNILEQEKKQLSPNTIPENQIITKYFDSEFLNVNDDWENVAKKLTQEHLTTHRNLRVKLAELLTNQIEEKDLNIRAIQILSRTVCAHTDIERAAASLSYLDVNRAAKLLIQQGLVISSPIDGEDEVMEEMTRELKEFVSGED